MFLWLYECGCARGLMEVHWGVPVAALEELFTWMCVCGRVCMGVHGSVLGRTAWECVCECVQPPDSHPRASGGSAQAGRSSGGG